MAMGGGGRIRSLWSEEEDRILRDYVEAHGEGRWNHIPKRTGLVNRCGKSCRLRWINYLSPKVKRGDFTEEEEDLIIRLHKLLGNRWSLIAGRVPGRTDNQVKNHWNTRLSKKLLNPPLPQFPTPHPNNHHSSSQPTTTTTTTMKQLQIITAVHQSPPLDDDEFTAANAMKDLIIDPFWDSGDMDFFFF